MKRMKHGGLFPFVAGAVLLTAGAAQAQDDLGNINRVTDRLKLSIGGMMAQDAAARSNNNEAWFLLSASYDLRKPSPSRLLDFAAYFDTGGNSDRDRFGVGSYRVASRSFVGVGVSLRMRFTPPNRPVGLYAMAGAGGYSLARNISNVYEYNDYNPYGEDTQEEYRDTIESRNRLSFGYKLGGGVSFGRGFFAEAAYYNLGRLQDTKYGGLGITLGARL